MHTTHTADLHLRGQRVFEQNVVGKAVVDWLTRTSWLHKCHFSCSEQNAIFTTLPWFFLFSKEGGERGGGCPRRKEELQTFLETTELFRESLLFYKDPHVHKKLSWLSSSRLLPSVQDHVRAKGLNSEASIQIRSSKWAHFMFLLTVTAIQTKGSV